MKDKDLWSVFSIHHRIKNSGGKYVWAKELMFYYGDLSKTDLTKDWRFKEIQNQRDLVDFLGTVNTNFPVIFPLQLNNNLVINSFDFDNSNVTNVDEEVFQ